MSVRDAKMLAALPKTDASDDILDGAASLSPITFAIASVGINQAAVVYGAQRPPFRGEIVGVTAWSRAMAATATLDVRINEVSVLTALFSPTQGVNPPARGTLVAARASRRFLAGGRVQLYITTNGTGTLTDLVVTVWVRPYPQAGEVAG